MIHDWLESAGAVLPSSRVRIHVYGDGSIDGELLYQISRGESPNDALGTIRNSVHEGDRLRPLSKNIWITIGARYTIKEDEQVYRRYNGMNEVGVHYQQASITNIGEVFNIFEEKSLKGLKKKYRRKAELIYVRLHWNPRRQQPQY